MSIKLNQLQENAIDLIMNSPRNSKLGLYGEAGTGKTFLLQQISDSIRIAFTAPTNKAVKVLIDSGCNPTDCMTIYSFLGLVVNESTGKVYIDKKGECKSKKYDILVVDEASMVDDIVCAKLKDLSHIKIIIVGDNAQLFPINLRYSPAFRLVSKSITLTAQMRQTNANHPIRPLLAILREAILTQSNTIPDLSKFSGQIVGDDGVTRSVIVIRNNSNFVKLIEQTSDKLNTDVCSAIAYRNNRVDAINDLCHSYIYPHSKFPYSKNEKLILQRPYKVNEYLTMNIGDFIHIDEIKSQSTPVYIGNVKFDIPSLLINDNFLVPSNRLDFNAMLNAMALQLNKGDKSFSWKSYYDFRDLFIHVKHSYCVTTHVSQGSTYDTTFVDSKDILSLPGTIEEKLRCLYTALSRTKLNTIILI